MSTTPQSRTVADLRLAGERCVLRPLRVEDAPAAFDMIHGRREILDWLVWQGPRTVDDLRDHYRHWRVETELGTSYHLAIARGADDAFCGSISVRPRDAGSCAEIGYWLATEQWGRGIGREAVLLACHLAFHELGLERVRGEVFAGNARSMRLLESLGFARSIAPHPFTCPDGRAVLEWTYELTRAEYERVHGGWEPREHWIVS